MVDSFLATNLSLSFPNHENALAFALLCTERLIPNYVAFAKLEGWGDVVPLHEAVDAGWSSFSQASLTDEALRHMHDRCRAVAPDTEDFDSTYTSPALSAASAAAATVDFMRTRETAHVIDVAQLCLDTVYMYVSEMENTTDDEQILAHPYVQAELERLRSDAATLSDSKVSIAEVVKMRRLPQSNIGLTE